MSELSPQAEKFSRIFGSLLKFYPRSHRKKYEQEMLQVFNDELAEAQRLNDPHVLRETFWLAVLGLPGSILREYFFATKDSTPSSASRHTQAWIATCIMAALLGTNLYAQSRYLGIVVGVTTVFLAITPIVWAFLSTRRALWSIVVLLLGLGVWGILQTAFAGLTAGSFNLMATDGAYALLESSIIVTQWIVPPLAMYGLALVFHLLPHHFRATSLNNTSEQELAAIREHTQHRRRLVLRVVLAFGALVVALNLIGLYDPPTEIGDLALPVIQVDSAQNMQIELAELDRIAHIDDQKFISDDSSSWDVSAVPVSLEQNQTAIELYIAASRKPTFQDPAFASLTRYKPGVGLSNVELTRLTGYRTASLLLLADAERLNRAGQPAAAIDRITTVLRVTDAVGSSQGAVITNMVATFIRDVALTSIQSLEKSRLSSQDREKLRTLLANLHDPSEGMIKALKVEFTSAQLAILAIRPQGLQPWKETNGYSAAPYVLPALLPWSFQPHRTIGIMAQNYREQIATLSAPCSESPAQKAEVKAPNTITFGLRGLAYNGIGSQFSSVAYYFDDFSADRCRALTKLNKLKENLADKSS